jgi:hypothetical protein
MAKKRKSAKRYKNSYRQFARTTDYATRGMVDMTKMAVAGTIGIGVLGTVASAIKK